MAKTKFGWKYYFAPTPKRVRVFGDSLFAAGSVAAGFAVLNDHPKIGVTISIVSVLGKFISNFFTENPEENG
jgi:anaerobic glycerol-3-phosphate dehydrogenase